jgi:hypothetical protein
MKQVIELAKILFLNSARRNSIADQNFATDLERLKKLVSEVFNASAWLLWPGWCDVFWGGSPNVKLMYLCV